MLKSLKVFVIHSTLYISKDLDIFQISSGFTFERIKSHIATKIQLPNIFLLLIACWYIPSEKIGQNFDPLRKSFFVTNYLHWTGTSVLQPFLGPPDPWGGLGGHGGVLGGLPPPKMPLCLRDQFKPWIGLFCLMVLLGPPKGLVSAPRGPKRPFWGPRRSSEGPRGPDLVPTALD